MSKGVTVSRNGVLIQTLFKVLVENQEDGIQAKDAIQAVSRRIEMTEHEQGHYKNGDQRFPKILRFATVDTVKAGWMLKEKGGTWRITQEGMEALKKYPDPEELYSTAKKLYYHWKKDQDEENEKADSEPGAETELDDLGESAVITLEEAEEQSWDEIQKYLAKINPYKLQDLVAALLEAMDYHIDYIAPPGPDGGLDIIAGLDPLGAKKPRIKVQVKRKNATITPDDYRSFASLIHPDEVGIFVNIGGFTKPTQEEARKDTQRRVTLVDARKLVDLWVEHADKIDRMKRNLLPLKPVFFLDLNRSE